MSVVVEWLGHCAFRITGTSRVRVLIDPYDETIGYKIPPFDCDILLISHQHYDTSGIKHVPGNFELIDKRGSFQVRGVNIIAIPAWHDKNKGRDYGEVLIFSIKIDGLNLAYFSHIGEIPKESKLAELGKIDLAFVPVGGVFALNPREAKFLIDQVKPKFVIPMHFQTRDLNFTLLPLSEFRKTMGEVWNVRDSRVELDKDNEATAPVMIEMEYLRGK